MRDKDRYSIGSSGVCCADNDALHDNFRTVSLLPEHWITQNHVRVFNVIVAPS